MTGTLSDHRLSHGKLRTQRSKSAVIFVAGLHVFFIWALWSGLAGTAITLVQNIDAALIDEAALAEALPPPPPDFDPPAAIVEAPEIMIDLAPVAVEQTITQVVTEAPVVAAPPPPPPTPPRAITSHAVTERDYPPISIRLQEQGTVRIRYLVSVSGDVSEVQVVGASGSERLDQAAIDMVMRRWKFEPATLNGQAVSVWQQAAVIFRLR